MGEHYMKRPIICQHRCKLGPLCTTTIDGLSCLTVQYLYAVLCSRKYALLQMYIMVHIHIPHAHVYVGLKLKFSIFAMVLADCNYFNCK